MDLASIIGLLTCIGMMVFGIVVDSSGAVTVSKLGNFFDLNSLLITVGGTLGCVLIFSSLKDFLNGLKCFGKAIKAPNLNEVEVVNQIIQLSNVARKDGLLALEELANEMEDEFLKKGLLLVVDGTDPEVVKEIMEIEMSYTDERHGKVIGFYESVAAMGPAWGMIGTLIGLINMLKNLSDISTVGPNMSVALVTTFYGSVIANWIGTPIASKLKYNNAREMLLREGMLQGILAIQAGENPRIIEEKLKSYLSPAMRSEVGAEGQAGGE